VAEWRDVDTIWNMCRVKCDRSIYLSTDLSMDRFPKGQDERPVCVRFTIGPRNATQRYSHSLLLLELLSLYVQRCAREVVTVSPFDGTLALEIRAAAAEADDECGRRKTRRTKFLHHFPKRDSYSEYRTILKSARLTTPEKVAFMNFCVMC
jgi:hypothetical protein